jgi:hypothetical protein
VKCNVPVESMERMIAIIKIARYMVPRVVKVNDPRGARLGKRNAQGGTINELHKTNRLSMYHNCTLLSYHRSSTFLFH